MSCGRRFALGAALAASLCSAAPAAAETVRDGGVYAEVTGTQITLGNALAERNWRRDGLVTLEMRDKRAGGHVGAVTPPTSACSASGPISRATSSA